MEDNILIWEGIDILDAYLEILQLTDASEEKVETVEVIKKLLTMIHEKSDLDTFGELFEKYLDEWQFERSEWATIPTLFIFVNLITTSLALCKTR